MNLSKNIFLLMIFGMFFASCSSTSSLSTTYHDGVYNPRGTNVNGARSNEKSVATSTNNGVIKNDSNSELNTAVQTKLVSIESDSLFGNAVSLEQYDMTSRTVRVNSFNSDYDYIYRRYSPYRGYRYLDPNASLFINRNTIINNSRTINSGYHCPQTGNFINRSPRVQPRSVRSSGSYRPSSIRGGGSPTIRGNR